MEALRARAERGQSVVCQAAFELGHAAGFHDAVDRGEGDLVLLGVLAGGFAEGGGRFFNVQDVVDDLEGEAYVVAVARERVELGGGSARANGPEAQAGAQQGAGLGAVDGFEQFGGRRPAFAFKIGDLAGNHAADGAGGAGELGDHACLAVGRHGIERGDGFECKGQQGVARQDGDGFAEYLVAGELAAAVIVIVEGGEIVVDERVGVDEFERARDGRGGFGGGRGDGAGGFQAEDRANALAARKQAIAHGAVDSLGRLRFGGYEAVEVSVDEGLLRGEVVAERAFFGRCGWKLGARGWHSNI